MVANNFDIMDPSVEDFFSQPMSSALTWFLRNNAASIKEDTVVISEDESSQQIFNSEDNIDFNSELIDLTGSYDPMEFDNIPNLNISDLTTENLNANDDILNEFLFLGSGVKSDIKPEEIFKTETSSNLQCSPIQSFMWLKCARCQYITLSKKSLEEHEMQHVNSNADTQQVFKCIGCPNIFYSLKSLIPHLENDHLVDNKDINNVLSAFFPINSRNDKSTSNSFIGSPHTQSVEAPQHVLPECVINDNIDTSCKEPTADNFKIFLRGIDNSNLIPPINEEYISVLTDEMLGINTDSSNKHKIVEIKNNKENSDTFSEKCVSNNTSNKCISDTNNLAGKVTISKIDLTCDPKNDITTDLHFFENVKESSLQKTARNNQDNIKADHIISIEPNDNDLEELSKRNSKSYIYCKPSEEEDKSKESPTTQLELEPYIKCTYPGCFIKMRSKKSILYHGRCHINECNIPVCPECVMYFNSWTRLHTHLWKVHKIDLDMYSCSKCDYKCNSLWMLNDVHSRTHLNEKLQKCSQCEKSFKNLKQLRNHQTIHKNKDVVNKCSICKKQFALKRNLIRHIANVHERIKDFLCSICGYNTATNTDLMLHYKGHGEKTIICEYCDYRTHDHNTMRKHKLRHSTQTVYKCTVCKYESIQTSAVKRHMKAKHPKKLTTLYLCSLCDYSTINTKSYDAHINTHKSNMKANYENSSSNSGIFEPNKNLTPDNLSDIIENRNISASPLIQNHSNVQSLNQSSIIRGTKDKHNIQNENRKNIKGQIKVKSNLVLKGPGSLINTDLLLSNYQNSNNIITIRKPSDLNLIQDVTLKPLKLTDKIQPMSAITRVQNENRSCSSSNDTYSNDINSKSTWLHHLDETSGIEYIDLDFDENELQNNNDTATQTIASLQYRI